MAGLRRGRAAALLAYALLDRYNLLIIESLAVYLGWEAGKP
jgi:hypothetical protein